MSKGIGTLITRSKSYYYSLKKVRSPLLDQDIIFNRYGWKHLLYDSSDHRRNNKNIELRLFLLREVKFILSSVQYPVITSTLAVSNKPHVMYYEFYGKSKRHNRFVKVIVRRIGKGNYHFFSIRRSKRNKNPAHAGDL